MLVFAAVLTIPLGLDLYLPVPEDNPLTAEKIELGRQLFHDRRLSRDGSISCSWSSSMTPAGARTQASTPRSAGWASLQTKNGPSLSSWVRLQGRRRNPPWPSSALTSRAVLDTILTRRACGLAVPKVK